jgi:predicted amidohydrolase YtcJ
LFKVACVATPFEEGGGAPADETLPVEDAFRMFSLWNAQVGYEDRDKGSIEVGKFGDFAVLSRDPTSGSAAALFETKVVATILGGQPVYRA